MSMRCCLEGNHYRGSEHMNSVSASSPPATAAAAVAAVPAVAAVSPASDGAVNRREASMYNFPR
jgi:hypothetical protein